MGQAPDLTPLLPPTTASEEGVRRAVLAGEFARAEAQAGSLAPAEGRLWRGIIAIVRNDSSTAIRALRGSGHPKQLGVAYYLARQYLLFRAQMEEAIRREPGDFGPYYYLGRHYDSDLDNCTEAVGWLRQAVERNPSYARAEGYLGSCLERLGRLQEAEQCYRASLGLPLSQLGMARLKLAAGDEKESLAWAERAVAAEPLNAAGQKLAARLYEGMGRKRDAIRALERAAKAAPYDASVHYVLYRLLRASGEDGKAAEALKEYERLSLIYGSQPN
jgi:tetratricopeptide (TPR) repeat protein